MVGATRLALALLAVLGLAYSDDGFDFDDLPPLHQVFGEEAPQQAQAEAQPPQQDWQQQQQQFMMQQYLQQQQQQQQQFMMQQQEEKQQEDDLTPLTELFQDEPPPAVDSVQQSQEARLRSAFGEAPPLEAGVPRLVPTNKPGASVAVEAPVGGADPTTWVDPDQLNGLSRPVKRRGFRHSEPQLCLAFLSCCGRIDLLERTMAAAVRHMEEDEPDVPYEVAWVDNGSPAEMTAHVLANFEIEHAQVMDENMGLAWGLNQLFFEQCTAPYVLILEEDWLYMDAQVAEQTDARRHAIRSAIEVLESNPVAYDGRVVMGVFLRPETYETFLRPPFVGDWQVTPSGIEHRPYCADTSGGSGYMWGSYTNGAGLYRRSHLENIGRMFGEPGDGFHDSYVEANYAFRAGLGYCHSMLRLEPGCDTTRGCNAAFYHIGGQRGTRPNKRKDIREPDDAWVMYGTEFYAAAKAQTAAQRAAAQRNAPEAPSWQTQDQWRKEYQQETFQRNQQVLVEEQQQRQALRQQAQMLRSHPGNVIRQHVKELAGMSDEQILQQAAHLEAMANSPHPLNMMGQQRQQQQPQQPPQYQQAPQSAQQQQMMLQQMMAQLPEPSEQQVQQQIKELNENVRVIRTSRPDEIRLRVPEWAAFDDARIYQIATDVEAMLSNRDAIVQYIKQQQIAQAQQQMMMQQQQQQMTTQRQPPQQPQPPAFRSEREMAEALAWQEAAQRHNDQGHKPFTGAGYQQQNDMVQERTGNKQQKSGLFGALSRALFGPGE